MGLTQQRVWFAIWYAGRLSRLAHSFSTAYERPEDGHCVAACGLTPYDQPSCPDARLVAFAPSDRERCPACKEALR